MSFEGREGFEFENFVEKLKSQLMEDLSPYEQQEMEEKLKALEGVKGVAEHVFDQFINMTLMMFIASAANAHFCRLVAHPRGINEPKPDYEAMADEAAKLAHETTPILIHGLRRFQEAEAKKRKEQEGK